MANNKYFGFVTIIRLYSRFYWLLAADLNRESIFKYDYHKCQQTLSMTLISYPSWFIHFANGSLFFFCVCVCVILFSTVQQICKHMHWMHSRRTRIVIWFFVFFFIFPHIHCMWKFGYYLDAHGQAVNHHFSGPPYTMCAKGSVFGPLHSWNIISE